MVRFRRLESSTRRRRVVTQRTTAEYDLYKSGSGNPTARERARLRDARRPSKTYAAGVRRRLRGRWFNLVPTSARALAGVISVISVIVAGLLAANHLATHHPSVAAAPELTRPFRFGEPGNLADWIGSQFLLLAAGCSLLIYQLRRHRADDFHGHYRLWRPIILLFLFASVDSVVRLRDALGAGIDLIQGDSVIMAGSDAVRLLMLIGGAALAVPVIQEIRRVPLASITVVLAFIALAVPTFTRLGLFGTPTQENAAMWAGATRLIGRGLLLIATIAYLRRLYREVRQLDKPIAEDASAATVRSTRRIKLLEAVDDENDQAWEESGIPLNPLAWLPRREKSDQGRKQEKSPPAKESVSAAKDERKAAPTAASDEEDSPSTKRRWRPALPRPRIPALPKIPRPRISVPRPRLPKVKLPALRMPKREADDTSGEPTTTQPRTSPVQPVAEETPKKRRWFGKGQSKPASASGTTAANKGKSEPERQRRASDDQNRDDNQKQSGEEELDPDSIDWATLSKSERRRLRKQLRRQGKAA